MGYTKLAIFVTILLSVVYVEATPAYAKNLAPLFISSIGFGTFEYLTDANGWWASNIHPRHYTYALSVGVIAYTYLAANYGWKKALYYMPAWAVLEDIGYFATLGITKGKYPYPAPNWWANEYGVVGKIVGTPIPFFPYVPTGYLIAGAGYLGAELCLHW